MNKKTLVGVILSLIGVGLLLFAGVKLWDWYRASHNPNPEIPTKTITHSEDKPDETPIDALCDKYEVADDQPRQIELPKLNKSGCIQSVGIDQNNAIAVPTNIHLAGWYNGSVLPGEKGVSLIDGHVLGRYNDAIFGELEQLKPGDIIRIQFGDKSWKEFKLLSSDRYSIEQTAKEQLKPVEGVERQLNLITCGGEWLRREQTFDQRVVVRTELVE